MLAPAPLDSSAGSSSPGSSVCSSCVGRRPAGAAAVRIDLGERLADLDVVVDLDEILVTVPEAGAGTSASTLSVETSTTVWPSSTESPSETCHSSTVPSVTDSPISGI